MVYLKRYAFGDGVLLFPSTKGTFLTIYFYKITPEVA
jgi:hypothetical protein